MDEAGEDTLDVVSLDVGKLFRTDSDDDLPLTVAEPSVMCEFVRPDTVPVVVVNMPTDVLGDDRFSPGVTCCVPLDRPSCIDPMRRSIGSVWNFTGTVLWPAILTGWVH